MSRIIDRGLEEQIVLLAKMGELTYETLGISLMAIWKAEVLNRQ